MHRHSPGKWQQSGGLVACRAAARLRAMPPPSSPGLLSCACRSPTGYTRATLTLPPGPGYHRVLVPQQPKFARVGVVDELRYLSWMLDGWTLRRLLHPGHRFRTANSQSEYITPWSVLAAR